MTFTKTKNKVNEAKHIPKQECTSVSDESPHSPKPAEPKVRQDTTDARLFKRNRSGGPTTAAGKEIAKQNSLKHGVYAQRPSETDEFFDLSRQVTRDLKPEGVIQMAIADSVASDIYRTRCIENYEHRQVFAALNGSVNVPELAKRVGFPWGEEFQSVLAEPISEISLQRELFEWWQKLAAPPKSSGRRALECMPDSRVSKNYEFVCEKLSQPVLLQHMEEKFFRLLDDLMLEARQVKSYLGKRIQAKSEEIFLVKYWLYRNQTAISQQVHALREEKALDVMTSEHLARGRASAANSLRNRLDAFASVRKLAK